MADVLKNFNPVSDFAIKEMGTGAAVVLGKLIRLSNIHGNDTFSYDDKMLASDSGYSRTSIIKYKKKLSDGGYIETKSGYKLPTIYTLNYDKISSLYNGENISAQAQLPKAVVEKKIKKEVEITSMDNMVEELFSKEFEEGLFNLFKQFPITLPEKPVEEVKSMDKTEEEKEPEDTLFKQAKPFLSEAAVQKLLQYPWKDREIIMGEANRYASRAVGYGYGHNASEFIEQFGVG